MPLPASSLARGRFDLLERLGAGGMGEVFRAFDRERGHEVALKRLRRADPPSLLGFKREFRALAHVSHPHLCTLYELLSDDGEWFFTMELVAGGDFLTHVRGAPPPRRVPLGSAPRATYNTDDADGDEPTPVTMPGAPEAILARQRMPGSTTIAPPLDAEGAARLRQALVGLCLGVDALHALGHLHRDLKPSNVLVTPAGRAVIVDLGVALALGDAGGAQGLAGTPAYMAPEQALGGALDEACDWYAVGIMLHEALAGRRPFAGVDAGEILARKHQGPPPLSKDRVPDGAEELVDLSQLLLRVDPHERPRGGEILRRLGAGAAGPGYAVTLRSADAPFVGRAAELGRLRAALAEVQTGRRVIAWLEGPSGVGKSTLTEHFLAEARGRGAVTLTGRCHPSESLPYKALDGVMDALATATRGLPDQPPMRALARLFPVLRDRVGVGEPPLPPGRGDVRRRAVASLAELLGRAAARGPLVLAVDDVQWGDLDSAALLVELLDHPLTPPLLLIVGARLGADQLPGFTSLLIEERPPTHHIRLDALDAAETAELARALLPDEKAAAIIASESAGLPLVVAELCAHAVGGGAPRRLEALVAQRVAELPPAARAILEWVVIAGRPLPLEVVRAAFAGGDVDEPAALALLTNTRLLRVSGSGESLETYHDLLRDRVLAQMDADERQLRHRELAAALEHWPGADPEALATHLAGAGERERAAQYAQWAARRAADALAPDRAAELYAMALELGGEPATLRPSLARALADAGRSAEAGEQFLLLAESTQLASDAQTEYLRLGAEHLAKSGHVERALAAFTGVLDTADLRLDVRGRGSLGALLATRLRLRLRPGGLSFRERQPPAEAALRRADVCWSMAMGFGNIDPPRAAEFTTRHLVHALAAGEPSRVARGLAAEVFILGSGGRPPTRRVQRCLADARRLAARLGDGRAAALADCADGLASYQRGDFASPAELSERAAAGCRSNGGAATWELVMSESVFAWSLFYLGRVQELAERVPTLVDEAVERGDLLARANFDSGLPGARYLFADDVASADRARHEVMEHWPDRGAFLVQHYFAAAHELMCRVYAGDGEEALRRLREVYPRYKRSALPLFRMARIEMGWLSAATALAAAPQLAGDRREDAYELAERQALRLTREPPAFAQGMAALIRSALARRLGDDDEALRDLAGAAVTFERGECHLFAAATRWRAGELVGGTKGAEAKAAAEAAMRRRGVKNVGATVGLLAPA